MTDTSCADLTELEYEFASNPNSEAFVPLAEAYRCLGRYVEAMVVCKKGIKAHPELPIGRIIMARIYSDQGKHAKAIEELAKSLKEKPDNPEAHSLLGVVYLKLGKQEEGVESLRKSLNIDSNNQLARETLLKMGIDHLPARSVKATPATKQEHRVGPAASRSSAVSARSTETRDAEVEYTKLESSPETNQAPGGIASRSVPIAEPTYASTGVVASPEPKKKRIADIYQAMEAGEEKSRKRGLKATLYMVGLLTVVLIVYVVYTWREGVKQEEINKYLETARPLFSRDTFLGYQKALDNYRAILKLEPKHSEALSRGAFICAVLVGEHRAERSLIDEGTKYVTKAMEDTQDNPMLISARSLITLYGGGLEADAIKMLEDALKSNAGSAILHTTLGFVLLKKGELDTASEHLLHGAQQNEIRAFMGLGRYARSRSLYREAQKAYGRALQVNRDHVGAVLEKSMLSLVWGESSMFDKQAAEDLERFENDLKAGASKIQQAEADLIKLILEMRSNKEQKQPITKLVSFADLHNSDPFIQFVIARELRRANRLKKAKDIIQKALRLNSTRPNFVLEEAEIALAMRDWEGARSRALRVQELDSKSGQSLLIVGQAYYGENNFEKAKKYFKDATEFEDVSAKARRRLAEVYMTQPKPDEDLAQAQLEPAIKDLLTSGEYRESAESAVMLAKIYAKKNLRSKFIETLKEALKADPTLAEPNCLIAANIDTNTSDGKNQVIEFCGKCIKLDHTGKLSQRCKEIIKKLN